nr:unknown Function [uncultured bacterium]
MKKIIYTLAIIFCLVETAFAQFADVQLHYAMGSYKRGDKTIRRDYFKTRFEMLNRDSIGTYYWSIDLDYNAPNKSISLSQTQIFHSIRIAKYKPIQPAVGHGGISGRSSYFFVGIHTPFSIGRVKFLPLLLYAYNKDAKKPDARLTIAYATRLLKNRISIFGFANTWTNDKVSTVDGSVSGKIVGWQLRPQVWFNMTRKLAIGTELDFSKNLYTLNKPVFLGSIGTKWGF